MLQKNIQLTGIGWKMINRITARLTSLLILVCGFGPLESSAAAPKIKLKRFFPNVKFRKPIQISIPEDNTNRLFLVQQWGQILILPEDRSKTKAKLFLNIEDRDLIDNDFEEGLLGLAFHPNYKENGRFFIYYSHQINFNILHN